MSTSQEELVVRMGLDVREFEKRLREAGRIADAEMKRLNSRMDQSTPQSWASLGGLSQKSQQLLKGSGGGLLGPLAEKLGPLAARFTGVGAAASLAVAPIKALWNSMKEVWLLAKEGQDLGVSSMFMLNLGKAAKAAGEDIADATGKLQRFSAVIGQAQSGEKGAVEALQKLGLSPWGKTMETIIGEAAQAFEKIADPAKRAQMAVELFGRGGQSTVEVLEKLAQAQAKAQHGMVEQRDLDTLAAGWDKVRGMIGGATSALGNYAKVWAATMLRWSGFVKNAPERTPPAIEAPGPNLEAQAKAEKELAKAREEYEEAARSTGQLAVQEVRLRIHALDIAKKINAIEGETVEKFALGKKLIEEQRKIKDLQKTQADEAARLEAKKADYAKQYLNLIQQQSAAQRTMAQATSDRSGWSVDEILQSDPRKLLYAARHFLGRNLSGAEVNSMLKNYREAWQGAAMAHDMGLSAKALRLLMPGMEGKATNMELFARGNLAALTGAERNPMAHLIEQQAQIAAQVADFVVRAKRDGLLLRPIMGK